MHWLKTSKRELRRRAELDRATYLQAIHNPSMNSLKTIFSRSQILTTKVNRAEHAQRRERHIYCGGGIAATINAFACHLMGKDNVSIYDGSLTEWNSLANRPIKLGSDP